MAEIKFMCSKCKQALEGHDSIRGQVVECPSCKAQIKVPALQKNRLPPTKTGNITTNTTTQNTKKNRAGIIIALVLGFIIGYAVGSPKFQISELGIPGKIGISPPAFGHMTKEAWRAKAYENFRGKGMQTPNVVWGLPGSVFTKVMGKPDRTQTVGEKVYWYYNCSDGVIQLEVGNQQGFNDSLYGEINDY